MVSSVSHALLGYTKRKILFDSFRINYYLWINFQVPYFEKVYGIKFITICPGATDTPMTNQSNFKLLLYHAGLSHMEELLKNNLDQTWVPSPSIWHENKSQASFWIISCCIFRAESCGKMLVDVMERGENGSVWVLDKNKSEAVTIPNYWKY